MQQAKRAPLARSLIFILICLHINTCIYDNFICKIKVLACMLYRYTSGEWICETSKVFAPGAFLCIVSTNENASNPYLRLNRQLCNWLVAKPTSLSYMSEFFFFSFYLSFLNLSLSLSLYRYKIYSCYFFPIPVIHTFLESSFDLWNVRYFENALRPIKGVVIDGEIRFYKIQVTKLPSLF